MFPGALNVIATVGWSTINTTVSAQTLRAVSDSHQLPTAAGVVIIVPPSSLPSYDIDSYERRSDHPRHYIHYYAW